MTFPWLNTVSAAVTMDSTTLLHFLSNATMETDVSMLHFLSNTTIEAETFRLLWRGDIKESLNELGSCVRELEELGRCSERY
jgi:hypothetical protein